MITVEICMGSSCYARGNSKSLELAEEYINRNGLENEVHLTGKLCLNNCSGGPNITINKNLHRNCKPECVIDLIKHYQQAE